MLFTSQEGRDYYANCYHYFIDLSHLEADLKSQGFEKTMKQDFPKEILDQPIPSGRYYVPFTMCLITLKSYKYQLFAVLDALYKAQT